jgi:type III restriction enzyme
MGIRTGTGNLAKEGSPRSGLIESRRQVSLITPIPKPRQRGGNVEQQQRNLALGDAELSTEKQQYNPTPVINEPPVQVAQWRK